VLFPLVTENEIHITCAVGYNFKPEYFIFGLNNLNDRAKNLRSLHLTDSKSNGVNRRGQLIFHGQRSAGST